MAAHVRMKFEKTGIRTNRDLVDHARMYVQYDTNRD
jgi:hypothetical protein